MSFADRLTSNEVIIIIMWVRLDSPHPSGWIINFFLVPVILDVVHTSYAGEIGKRSFILGLPTTLIQRVNGAFRNLKTPALRFSVEAKHFENGTFRKRSHHVISLPELFSNTNPKGSVIVAFSNLSGVVQVINGALLKMDVVSTDITYY